MLQKSDSIGILLSYLRPLLGAVVLVSTLTATSLSYAQKADGLRLEEIVVTATRRSVSLQDVPLAVTALSAEDIESRGLNEFSDYLNSMPSVQLIDLAPGRNQIRIRGISTSEFATPPTVAVYLGEVPMTVTSGSIRRRAVRADIGSPTGVSRSKRISWDRVPGSNRAIR